MKKSIHVMKNHSNDKIAISQSVENAGVANTRTKTRHQTVGLKTRENVPKSYAKKVKPIDID